MISSILSLARTLVLILLHAWHYVPREDYTNTWYAGPARGSEAWCWVDPLGQPHVNDLPLCLEVLQNLGRLDLAEEYIEASGRKIDQ